MEENNKLDDLEEHYLLFDYEDFDLEDFGIDFFPNDIILKYLKKITKINFSKY